MYESPDNDNIIYRREFFNYSTPRELIQLSESE
jgi:hypothetical protein